MHTLFAVHSLCVEMDICALFGRMFGNTCRIPHELPAVSWASSYSCIYMCAPAEPSSDPPETLNLTACPQVFTSDPTDHGRDAVHGLAYSPQFDGLPGGACALRQRVRTRARDFILCRCMCRHAWKLASDPWQMAHAHVVRGTSG